MTKKKNKGKVEWYVQCTYTSPTIAGHTTGVTVETAWIPEKFAQVGRTIYFGKATDTPDRIWTVTSVGGRKPGDYIMAHERDYKTQRDASDI